MRRDAESNDGPAMRDMTSPAEYSQPTRSLLHRAAFGTCLLVAGLLLVGSILMVILYAVAVVQFFSGFAD